MHHAEMKRVEKEVDEYAREGRQLALVGSRVKSHDRDSRFVLFMYGNFDLIFEEDRDRCLIIPMLWGITPLNAVPHSPLDVGPISHSELFHGYRHFAFTDPKDPDRIAAHVTYPFSRFDINDASVKRVLNRYHLRVDPITIPDFFGFKRGPIAIRRDETRGKPDQKNWLV